MMKKLLGVIICSLSMSMIGVAQNNQAMNFIITINDKIDNISKISLFVDTGESISLNYVPGELIFKEHDYSRLLSMDSCKLLLKLTYVEMCNDDITYHNYEIDFNNKWLNESYFILNIYDMNEKKYRKLYDPLPGKTYNYDYRSSNTVNGKLLQKKLTKKQKKCLK